MPRERLQRLGASALADYELLAILLRTGGAGRNVLELARDLLARRGGLTGLFASQFTDLLAEKGLGKAKIAEILAVAELSRRFLQAPPARASAGIGASTWTRTTFGTSFARSPTRCAGSIRRPSVFSR